MSCKEPYIKCVFFHVSYGDGCTLMPVSYPFDPWIFTAATQFSHGLNPDSTPFETSVSAVEAVRPFRAGVDTMDVG